MRDPSRFSGLPGRLAAMLAALVLLAFAPPGAARTAPDSFAELVEKLSPAVVNITTTQNVTRPDAGPRPVVPEGSPFEEFFRDFRERRQDRPRQATSLGSGFIVSADGYIVTNNHVIEKADQITIEFFSGKEMIATIVGRDEVTDIALLKVESPEPLPFVKFGNSDLMRVGDWVVAIGNPLGQGFSVSAGIVSARNRVLQNRPDTRYDDFIQTDAAINRGNSGGPLFNLAGEVIGVNTAILSPNGGSIGIGFSMSSNVVTKVVDQLREFGETRRGWIGVSIQELDEALADALGMKDTKGTVVSSVTEEGPAAKAGIRPQDVIVAFDGQEVRTMRDLPRIVAGTPAGRTVDVTVFRGGETLTLPITVGLQKEDPAAGERPGTAPEEPARPAEVLGLTLVPLTPETRQEHGVLDAVEGVLVSEVAEGSDAWEKGMRPGDVVVEIGQEKVRTPRDCEKRIAAAREAGRSSILLLVQREGQPRFVALPLGN